jgi:adenylate cyclase
LTCSFRSALTQDPRLGIGLRRAFAEQERRTVLAAAEPRHGPPLGALVNLHLGPSSYYLNFYGPPGTVRTIPYHALAADPRPGRNDDLDLAGASVFVGYSEFAFPSKVDGFDTVFTRSDGVQLSGVEIAATAFANLLTGRCLRPADTLTKSLILLAFGCAVGACAFLLPPSRAMPAAIGLAASYVVGAQLFFGRADVWLPLAVPVFVQLPALLFTGLLCQRKNIWRAIRIFVPDKVAKQTAEHPHDPIAVKQTAFATCLASDAEDYTALSERMAPAEAAAFLNDYFEALAVPLRRHEADFREFHADSMLSAWIANTPDVSVRKRACLAAIDAIDAFNARKAPLHLGIRLGLHAGEIFLGNVGAGGRFAFRLVGDIVNTASRIESLNKALGTRLLATEAVVAEVDGLLLRPPDGFS